MRSPSSSLTAITASAARERPCLEALDLADLHPDVGRRRAACVSFSWYRCQMRVSTLWAAIATGTSRSVRHVRDERRPLGVDEVDPTGPRRRHHRLAHRGPCGGAITMYGSDRKTLRPRSQAKPQAPLPQRSPRHGDELDPAASNAARASDGVGPARGRRSTISNDRGQSTHQLEGADALPGVGGPGQGLVDHQDPHHVVSRSGPSLGTAARAAAIPIPSARDPPRPHPRAARARRIPGAEIARLPGGAVDSDRRRGGRGRPGSSVTEGALEVVETPVLATGRARAPSSRARVDAAAGRLVVERPSASARPLY